MDSFSTHLGGLVLLSHLFLVTTSKYFAKFTLPDNNQYPATPLGNIMSKLQPPFPQGTYQIITRKCSYSKFNSFFHISESGDLLLSRSLDRDDVNNVCGPLNCCDKANCLIELDLIVTLRRSNHKNNVKVLIEILDENDNAPHFMERSFTISIFENEKNQNRYSLPSAFDKDSLSYNIKEYTLSGNGFEGFSLERSNDLPFIIAKKPFDYEDKSQRRFQLVLTAEDHGGKYGTLNLEINIADVNDNAPICVDSKSNISVSENTTYENSIFDFRATDLDSGNNGRISFTFSSTTVPIVKDTFKLDRETGGLFLSKKLDYELYSEQTYKIYIQVSDNGAPQLSDLCSIEIHVTDINDNSPIIEISQVLPIPENTLVKEPVLTFYTRDEDSTDNEVTCRADESSPGLKLVQVEKSYYFIYAKGVYDHEKERNLSLLLICQDSAKEARLTKQWLTIPIKDKNDNIPKFSKSKYQSYILEDFALNKTFISVKATDDDSDEFGRISYDLGLESRKYFSIDKESGDLALLRPLDRELMSFFNVTVVAVDTGNFKGYANIDIHVVDVNDNAPKVVYGMQLNVSENAVHGSIVGHFMVRDLDLEENGMVEWRYELLGNATSLLVVDNFTIMTAGDIDREVDEHLLVLITMNDKGTPPLLSSCTITVSVLDQNDNIPEVAYPKLGSVIEEIEGMAIPTNTPRFTQVLAIKSNDPDIGINGRVLYRTVATNGSKYFFINQTGGQVLTNWAYDTISFTPAHPSEGLYKLSFTIYNQVLTSNNLSASSLSSFFIRVVPYRHFVSNEIFQQNHRRPLLNNVVLLILIGGFTVSLSAALIAAIIWAKSKYSSESSTLQQVHDNDGKFMMMMITGEQPNTNNTYVYDPYSTFMMDHERTIDSTYSLGHSKSSTFNSRRIGKEYALMNNYDNKTLPRNVPQQDVARHRDSDLYNHSNSLSTTDLINSASANNGHPKLTNSFYRHFEHDLECHSPILQSVNRHQSLERQFGAISPRAASICDPTQNIPTTSNWVPRISSPDTYSNSNTIC